MQLEEESMQKGKWYGILPNIIPTTTKDDLYKRKFMSFFHSLILNEVFFFFFHPSVMYVLFFLGSEAAWWLVLHIYPWKWILTHTLALYKTQHKKMILKWKNAESCFSSPSCIPVHMLCDSLSSWFKFLFCAWIRQETDHWHII